MARPINARMQSRDKTTEAVKKRAYELYLKRGRVPGHEWEDWFEAERQIKREWQSSDNKW